MQHKSIATAINNTSSHLMKTSDGGGHETLNETKNNRSRIDMRSRA